MSVRSMVFAMALMSPFMTGCAARAMFGGSGAAAGDGVLTGTVTYRERMALPPGAVIEVWITDATPGLMTPAAPIGRVTLPADGRQVPIPFELPFDRTRIDRTHVYAASASISAGGETLFTSQEEQRVITLGSPRVVRLMLSRVAGDAPAVAMPASAPQAGTPASLGGTRWRLDRLEGRPAATGVETTLEFFGSGRAGGQGGCNRYTGSVTFDGAAITFSAMISTQMACAEPGMGQESRFLRALGAAERFEVDGQTLRIFVKGASEPLVFVKVP